MEKSLKSISINYGLLLALILVLITVIGYIFSLKIFVAPWFNILLLLIIVTLGIISSLKVKKNLNGFISFKNTFTAYFIVIVIGLFLANIFNYILLNIIDPETNSLLREIIIEAQLEGMEKWGTPQDTLDEMRVKLEETENYYSLKNVGINLGFKLVIYTIIGLISSLIIRKEDPNAV